MSDSKVRQKYKRTPIYDAMVDEHDIFENYIDCFVFFATLGYDRGRYDATDYTGDGEMLWMHFGSRDLYRATAAAIAYQHTDDPQALVRPETQLEVMAKYAAGGAAIAAEEFGDVAGDPPDALLNFVRSNRDTDSADERDSTLDEIVAAFDDDILDQ